MPLSQAGPSKLWVAAFIYFKTWHIFGHKTCKITSRKARQIVCVANCTKIAPMRRGGAGRPKINHFEQIVTGSIVCARTLLNSGLSREREREHKKNENKKDEKENNPKNIWFYILLSSFALRFDTAGALVDPEPSQDLSCFNLL